MSESQYEQDLQRTANIDKIRDTFRKVKIRELIQRKRDAEDEAQELDFDNLQGIH